MLSYLIGHVSFVFAGLFGLACIIFYGNENVAQSCKYRFGKEPWEIFARNSDKETDREAQKTRIKRRVSAFGTMVLIVTAVPPIFGIDISRSWKYNPSEAERALFASTSNCILGAKCVEETVACLTIFGANFPASPQLGELQSSASRVSKRVPACTTPSPPVSMIVPPEKVEVARKILLGALRGAAESWRSRRGADYQDFSKIVSALTEDDKRAFSEREIEDYQALYEAEKLIEWTHGKLTRENEKQVPIMFLENSGGLNDVIAGALSKRLRQQGFNIVYNVSQAALFIQISGAENKAPFERQEFQGIASFLVTTLWVGGESVLFEQPVSASETRATYNSELPEIALDKAYDTVARSFAKWLIGEH